MLEAASTSLGAFCAGAVLYQVCLFFFFFFFFSFFFTRSGAASSADFTPPDRLQRRHPAGRSAHRGPELDARAPLLLLHPRPPVPRQHVDQRQRVQRRADRHRLALGHRHVGHHLPAYGPRPSPLPLTDPPVCATPLLTALFLAHRRAAAHAPLTHLRTPYQLLGARRLAIQLVQQLDLLGLLLLVAVFALILVPLTVAGGGATAPAIRAAWTHPRTLAPLAVGLVLLPVFVAWELRAAHPMVPFRVRAPPHPTSHPPPH